MLDTTIIATADLHAAVNCMLCLVMVVSDINAMLLTSRLGLAYAGSCRGDIIEVLTPVMWDANSSFEVS